MRPGAERQEFEYIRHGTQTLTLFDVAQSSGQSNSRGYCTEADYLKQQLIATDPNAVKWHLVMDCLNTHQSESDLWRNTVGLEIDLGVKGESGILTLHANSV